MAIFVFYKFYNLLFNMPKIQPIANEQDFRNALNVRPVGKGKPKKTALGKNLYLVTSLKAVPDGETDLQHAFQLRIFGNGQDRTRTIGHYPAMTYEDARKKADEEWAEQKKAREEGREAELKRLYEDIRAGKMPIAPLPCFRSIKDAAAFIEQLKVAIDSRLLVTCTTEIHENRRLFPNIPTSPIQNEDLTHTKLKVEIYLAIWLMLLMPARANVLIDLPGFGIFQWSAIFSEYSSVTVNRATRIAKALLQSNASPTPAPFLFHHLSQIKGNDRREKIAEAIKDIWPEYPIQTNRFKAFFEDIAIKHSEFQVKFIKENTANKRPYKEFSKDSFQIIALAEWWGWQLDAAQDIFKIHTPKPWS